MGGWGMGRGSRQSAISYIPLLGLVGGLLLQAQANTSTASAGTPTGDHTFRIDVRLVRLLVTAKNPSGDLVGDLTRGDFRISDNGVPQEIVAFERQTAQPLSVSLLIDTSLSTKKDLRLTALSGTKFLNALIREGNPEDAASLYTFSSEVTLQTEFTRRIARVEETLQRLEAESGTSMYDALYLSSSNFRDRPGRHVVVAVTDGTDTTSKKKYREAVESVQRADAVLYPIVIVPISNPAGRNTGGEHALETLAAATGGRTFYPTIGDKLDQAFDQILRDLRTQYLVTYYPKGVGVGRGAYHRVGVELPKRNDLRISARSGYYEDVVR